MGKSNLKQFDYIKLIIFLGGVDKMPKVTVIMPVYNAEKYIRKAINSMFQQSYPDFELLIIDDCSTDSSMKIVDEFKDKRLRIIRNLQNKGIAYSRNRGIDESKGEYIALMDDDDIAIVNRLEKQVCFLDETSNIDVVGGAFQVINEQDEIIKTSKNTPLNNPRYIKAYLMLYDAVANGSAMFRKEFVNKFDIRYQDNYLGMEDYRFWIDCSLNGNITNLEDVFLLWRNHGSNESSRVNKTRLLERKKLYAKIQRYALVQNGYSLDERELDILNKVFSENGTRIENKNEFEVLHKVLKQIIKQAKEKGFKNAQEIKIMCKKLFAGKTLTSYLWD